ncbi:MAG: glycoside hydrolase [Candidatus Glassbacteria bacterium]
MKEDALSVIILWHLHQPPYKDPQSNSFVLPWVRLHAIKNYFFMIDILRNHPGVRVTFNLTPCLIEQLEAYTLGESDNFLELTMKPSSELSMEEKEELLWSCFLLNWGTQLVRFPRYTELLSKRGRKTPRNRLRERLSYFTEGDLRDLQVLFNLAWFNASHLKDPDLAALVEKGRGFDEADKNIIREKSYRIIGEILPAYSELERAGQIELSTTPYYHPIMPLLCDTSIGKVAVPTMNLPRSEFSQPDDAVAQMKLAIEKYKSLTGKHPNGIWPSEGSVSEEVLEILSELGIRWTATDEEILARSKDVSLIRGADYVVSHPELLYRPFRAGPEGKEVTMFFRDRYLSDHISFVYSGWSAERSVEHVLDYLDSVYKATRGRIKSPVISIILDGENPWEYYDDDGINFLDILYTQLGTSSILKTVTPSQYLRSVGDAGNIEKLEWIYPGSWINANFRIWIGHPEDNRAWELLHQTRKTLVEFASNAQPRAQSKIHQAWQEIFMAEASDWFWWYGDDHSSATDAEFDRLFRMHLMRVYEILDEKIPAELYHPISSATRRQAFMKDPRGKLTVYLDGLVSSFYEWYEAGHFEIERIGDARAIEEGSVDAIFWGESSGKLVLRVDFREGVKPWPGIKLWLKILSPIEAKILVFDGSGEGTIVHDGKSVGQFRYDEILELYIDCESLSINPDDEILFHMIEKSPKGFTFQHPRTEVIVLKLSASDDPDWIV